MDLQEAPSDAPGEPGAPDAPDALAKGSDAELSSPGPPPGQSDFPQAYTSVNTEGAAGASSTAPPPADHQIPSAEVAPQSDASSESDAAPQSDASPSTNIDAPTTVGLKDGFVDSDTLQAMIVTSDGTAAEVETTQVEEGTTPVEEDTTQVEEGTTPLEEDTTQVEKGTIQVEEDAKQVEKGTTQVERDTTQLEEGTTPVERDTTEVEERTTPVERDTTQLEKGTTQVERDTTEVEEGTTPVERDTTEVEEGTTPVERDTTEVEKETTPVEDKSIVGNIIQEGDNSTEAIESRTDDVESNDITDSVWPGGVSALDNVESPMVKSESPMVRSESPMVRSESPMVRSESPMVRSESPMVRSESPMVRSESPMVRSESPMVRSESLMVRSESEPVLQSMDTSLASIAADEDSCQSGPLSGSATSPQKRTRVTNSRLMLQSLPQGVGAEALFEYRWPPNENHTEYWMLQEQVSAFLEVKSFRRKYPDLERRQIDIEERNYLLSIGVVTEMQCDLGLTALRSEDISDLMVQDYSDKYDEYAKVLRKREEERLAKKHKDLQELRNSVPPQTPVSKMDIKRLTERAVKSAANYNAFLMREKREERRHYYDIQTGIVQYPKHKRKALPPEMTRPTPYPVAVLRGQYSDGYKKYSSDELNYLPVKTVRYDPPLRIHNPYMPLPPDERLVEGLQQQVEADPTNLPTTIQDVSTDRVHPPPAAKKHVTKLLQATCGLCGREENREGVAEKCIKCNQCLRETHPSCSELTDEMMARIVTYTWMCMECKVCVRCSDPGNEDKMIVCDRCDRGYHTFCVGLKSIPEESIWACPECTAAG